MISGTLGLKVDGEERLLGPGESFVVRAGASHLPRNAGEDELRFVAEIRPAGRFEKFLAEITAANNSGRGGLAYLLAAAQVLHRFPDVERPTPLPRPVERALFAVLAGAGRLIFHVFGALAEFERETIRERTMAGLESARARGVTAGGPGRSTRAKPGWRGVSKTRASNSVEEICSMPGVGRSTLHRYLGEGDVERSERG